MRLAIFRLTKGNLPRVREGTARAWQLQQAGITSRSRVLGAIHGD